MTLSRLLRSIARAALWRPGLLLLAGVPPLLLGLYACSVPLDFSFAGVMDRSQPEVARYFAASERYGLGGLLPLLVEGPEERLDEAVLELELALDDLDEVRSVASRPPREWLLVHSPWIVDRETFDLWLELAASFPDAAREAELRTRLESLEALQLPPDRAGHRLVRVSMRGDPFELDLDSDHFPRIREITRATLARFGALGRYAGMPAIITQEQEATIERMRLLGPLSLVLVLLLFGLIERRLRMLASVALPLLLSVGAALGVVGLISGKLTLMESVFGVIVFGLGIDFAIHLIVRLREEQDRGTDFAHALERAIGGTGRGIIAAGVTTAGAFFVLALSPDPVFYRLGLSGGVGLFVCLLLLIVMLPAEWVLIERHSRARPQRPALFEASGLARLAGLSARAPGSILAVALLVVIAAGVGITRLRYETDLERVFSRQIDAVETARRIHELYGVDPGPWLAAVDGLDEARRVTAAFAAQPIFERSESLAFLFPEDLAEREQLLAGIVPGLARRVRDAELAARSLDAAEAEQARRSLEAPTALLRAEAFGPPTRDTLPESLSERLIGPDGELLVYAFVAEPALDAARAGRERAAAQAIHPRATSINAVYAALLGAERPWLRPMIAAIMIFIAFVLYLDLRSARLALLAMLPVSVASFACFGLLGLAGFAFNTVTLVGVPLLFGLGVDDGIHVVHRMLEQPDDSLERVTGAVGRGIAMTTLTTCASVSTLLLTGHPGIESLAILLLVGLPLCLLASVTLLPACAVLLRAQALTRARMREA